MAVVVRSGTTIASKPRRKISWATASPSGRAMYTPGAAFNISPADWRGAAVRVSRSSVKSLAARGEKLYGEHCVRCHANIDRDDPRRKVVAMVTAIDVVGTDEKADAIVLGDLGPMFSAETLSHAFRQMMDGAELITLQHNRYWKREDGLVLDVGAFAAALEYAAETEAVVVGKPSAVAACR